MNHLQLDSTIDFAGGLRELVRGREQEFINELRPLVQSQSVCLNLSRIERIDAAGLAALIALSRDARQAGHEFTVVNPSHHVARIFALVGLDRFVSPKDSRKTQPSAPAFEMVTV